jgi:hypothetical protein
LALLAGAYRDVFVDGPLWLKRSEIIRIPDLPPNGLQTNPPKFLYWRY